MKAMVVKTIVHFEIPADDVASLSKFYSDIFGWKFKETPMGEMTYWMISTGPNGKSVPGGMYKKMGGDERPRNYIQVQAIDDAISRFSGAGGKELMGKQEVPNVGFTYIGTDPEGNVVGLHEPTRKTRRAPPKAKAKKAKPKKSRK
jgi:predicted enzyme related to lactoylglutathione lyase